MKLAQCLIHGAPGWCLTTYSAGRRKRQYFTDEDAAKKALRDAEKQEAAVGKAFEVMSARDKARTLTILAEIDQSGLTLAQVWDGFRAKPTAAARQQSLKAAFDEMLLAKEQANCRPKTLKNYKWYVGKFIEGRSALNVASITANDCQSWFMARKESPASIRVHRRILSGFFNFCVRKGYMAKNPIKELEPINMDRKAPAVLTLLQSWTALVWSRRRAPKFLAWTVKALLLGLRPDSEADHSPIVQSDLDKKRFVVARSKVRDAVPRVLELDFCPPALEWLRLAKKLSGTKPLSYGQRRKYLRRLREYLGFKRWPQDVLRHTAASNLLSYHQDAGKVAHFLGNSPGVLLKDYKALVYREDAVRFMTMLPERALRRKVVRMPDKVIESAG